MKRARSGPTLDPGAGRQLEVLGDPAVEEEALPRIGRVGEAQRIAHPVIALLVEGLARQLRLRANSRA